MVPVLPAVGQTPDVGLLEINARQHVHDWQQRAIDAVIGDKDLFRLGPRQVE